MKYINKVLTHSFLVLSFRYARGFSGQGWCSTLKSFDGLMRARNTRASQSPLRSEIKVLIWTIECMRNVRQLNVTFGIDCSQLNMFLILKSGKLLRVIWNI